MMVESEYEFGYGVFRGCMKLEGLGYFIKGLEIGRIHNNLWGSYVT